MKAAQPSDADLIATTREGDLSAYGTLWERHASAAAAAARATGRPSDVDDIVSEAYLRVLEAIRGGNGPTEAFRPYLYRAVSSVAINWGTRRAEVPSDALDREIDPTATADTSAEDLDQSLVAEAYRSLDPADQAVLWYTEVEGLAPAGAAVFLGESARNVATKASRARAQLRTAWVKAHIRVTPETPACVEAVSLLDRLSRNRLHRTTRQRVTAHIAGCAACTLAAEEYEHVNSQLRAVLLPGIFGVGGAVALASELANAAGATGGGAGSAAAGLAPGAGKTTALLAIAAVSAGGLIVLGGALLSPGETTAAAPPAPGGPGTATPREQPEPAEREPSDPGQPTAPEQPEPNAPAGGLPAGLLPAVPALPPQVAPPVVPPVVAPPVVEPPVDPEPPTQPGAPTVNFRAETGRVSLSGDGGVPGAVIEVWGERPALDGGGPGEPPALLATVAPDADGSWRTGEIGGITPVGVNVWAVQRSLAHPALVSDPVSAIDAEFFVPVAETLCGSGSGGGSGGAVSWTLFGWPGARWGVELPSGSVVSGTFDAAGIAAVSIPRAQLSAGGPFAGVFGYSTADGVFASDETLVVHCPHPPAP